MYNLFLDDIREPRNVYQKEKDWIVVRTYENFVKQIEAYGMPIFVSFDHDLTLEHYSIDINDSVVYRDFYKTKTGYDALVWMCEYAIENNKKLPKMKFHTSSKFAFKYMNKYYAEFIKNYPELHESYNN